jgi:diguanylate cyclase (GGDEF)-like protein
LLRAAIDTAMPGLILLDASLRVRHVTPAANMILGLPPDGHIGMQILRALARSYWLDEAALQTLATAFAAQDLSQPRKTLLTVPNPKGARTLALDLRAAGDAGFVASLIDVTQVGGNDEWLLDQALTDPVTGLWNRQHFTLLLRDRLDGPQATGTAVLRLDLKRFRNVAQTQGAAAADLLLRLAGRRLSFCLRGDDVLARFASDEFAIMVTGMPHQEALAGLSERLAERLARPFLIEGRTVVTGANMGVACAPEDGDRGEVLLANAGLALADARAQAKGRLRFFEPRLSERARMRREVEGDLRQALARGELEIQYQPRIVIQTRRLDGFEALVRWRCPRRGMVALSDFIPLAKDLGLIGDIGEWVVQEACAQAVHWPDGISIAVNASPQQMQAPGLTACVERALRQTGLPGHRLEIEVTENLLLHHEAGVLANIAELRALGARLVLDDFGTGCASLSQLAGFRFDRIKIDPSLIGAPEIDGGQAVIVRTIAALGASLGVPTTAQGVETAAQLNQLRQDGCTSVQGSYFSQPLPASELAPLLRQDSDPPRPPHMAVAEVQQHA